ncbi:DedA family protein [Vibrio ulleungensis]|uniref:DedA family protein n=1 Tax=Vibrio ulleungensis TaxID=2807619 RepID=A0ABS2HFU4_9VIBR|nr:DedA family protein [Vibrio ulleungensis]MBM7035287.1 DedA family protein [Vibrio ulleungensis]
MQEILSAIWVQDFNALLQVNSLHILLLLLGIVLFLESSFVFLPLPGDGLVLFVGGLIGIGAIEFSHALILLSSAAFTGSIVAYLQGRWLQGTSFIKRTERTLPDDALAKTKRLLSKYGFLALFVSRFIPFVRVLTPMLMGISKLNLLRTVVTSLTSAITWVLTLLLTGKYLMRHPFIADHQDMITKWFLIGSFLLMLSAFIALFIRFFRAKNNPQHLA